MDEAEAGVWHAIRSLVDRFQRADRIVLGMPMWNFAYPYKLKQLIDLVSQRNMLFAFDGTRYGPMLDTPRALVVYARGQGYAGDAVLKPAEYDHQTAYIEFWLRFIAVQDVRTVVVDHTWDGQASSSLEKAKQMAARIARDF